MKLKSSQNNIIFEDWLSPNSLYMHKNFCAISLCQDCHIKVFFSRTGSFYCSAQAYKVNEECNKKYEALSVTHCASSCA